VVFIHRKLADITQVQSDMTRDISSSLRIHLSGKQQQRMGRTGTTNPEVHLFVAAWLWENEVKFRWPRLSAQYHKAWKASFTTGSSDRG
jgi:hypothetical protein